MMFSHHSLLFKYQSIVWGIPVSKVYFGFHPNSVSNLVGSIAYLISWPFLSETNLINDSGLPKAFKIVLTTSKLVLSLCPPTL